MEDWEAELVNPGSSSTANNDNEDSSWNSGGGGFGGSNGGRDNGDDSWNSRGRGVGGRDSGRGDAGSSWSSGFGGFRGRSHGKDNEGSSWNSGGGGFGRSNGDEKYDNNGNTEDNDGSSWNTGGGGFGGRGGGRGGRGISGGGRGSKSSYSSGNDDNDNDGFGAGFGGRDRDDQGGRGRRGGRRGGFGGGGYRGRDEEVFSRGPSVNDDEKGEAEDGGPKVSYVPPPPPEEEDSIFAHYETGINFDKYDEILVDVSGSNPPQAIVTFEEARLCETLSRNTGSGKTAAFLLPILQQLMADGVAASRFSEIQEPEAIIVAPTRELINQIYLEARKFAFGTCVRPVVVYGGISTGYTIREVLKGCNVLCGTPGRLLDIIGRGKVGLNKLRYLVLDEADRMLDMGFEPDMRKLVGSPGMPSKEERQTLMFSATYPEDIQRLAGDFLKTDYLFWLWGRWGGACSDVEQNVCEVTQYSKRDKLVELLQMTGTERTMVFVETKRKADFIATFLCQENISTTSIHGDREQREREQPWETSAQGSVPSWSPRVRAPHRADGPLREHREGPCPFFDPTADAPLARSLVKVLSGAQQEVPSWLEEIAFSTHGTTGFNPRGKVFASVDTRKRNEQPVFESLAEGGESWD
ncbi:hypothetical protein SKAU_G00017300 [Synaphobranchus kaupii]|uniref:RNA helicase n=1 Tax=Synaphobranchus kaupii TaxID=118154 RepID=A0A9Q1JDY7_SYNKA|nr:hypothetical protein SKAU_G00017300 [Synaphobranchus kaupii]